MPTSLAVTRNAVEPLFPLTMDSVAGTPGRSQAFASVCAPNNLTDLFTSTSSGYVPAATRMSSPSEACPIAQLIVLHGLADARQSLLVSVPDAPLTKRVAAHALAASTVT